MMDFTPARLAELRAAATGDGALSWLRAASPSAGALAWLPFQPPTAIALIDALTAERARVVELEEALRTIGRGYIDDDDRILRVNNLWKELLTRVQIFARQTLGEKL